MKTLEELVAGEEKDPTNYWTFGKDEMLDIVAYDILVKNEIPDHKEAIAFLGFLACFAVGCRRMELDELADLFNERCEKYTVLLGHIGYQRGTFERERFCKYQPLGDIVSWASSAIKGLGPID